QRDEVQQAVYDATRNLLEEIASQIQLCLRYFAVTFRGHRPQKIVLSGGESFNTDVQNVLTKLLSLPVERSSINAWTTAIGLALKKTSLSMTHPETINNLEAAHA